MKQAVANVTGKVLGTIEDDKTVGDLVLEMEMAANSAGAGVGRLHLSVADGSNEAQAAEEERLRIVAYLSHDTTYTDDFCIRRSHCPTNCICERPVYMTDWKPDDALSILKTAVLAHDKRKPQFYVLTSPGCVEVDISIPCDTDAERDELAKQIRASDDYDVESDGIYRLDIDEHGTPSADSFVHGFFGDE